MGGAVMEGFWKRKHGSQCPVQIELLHIETRGIENEATGRGPILVMPRKVLEILAIV